MNFQLIIFVTAICFSSVFAAPQQNAAPQVTEMEKTISTGVNSFAVDTLRSLHKSEDQKNILLSPINVYLALSFCHLGSAGITRNELAAVMGLPQDDSKKAAIHEGLKSISQKIQYKPADPQLVVSEVTMANGLFVQQGFSIKPSFVSEITGYYGGKVSNLDFAKNPAGATDTINQWASEQTKGRIPKLYSEPLDQSTVMVLASSLYFNGRWKERFPPHQTKVEKFNTGVKDIEVQMMNDQQFVHHGSSSELQVDVIALPYYGEDIFMIIMLPHPTQTLKNLTEHLDVNSLRDLKKKSQTKGVDYKIPRMKFAWNKSLKESLSSRGLKAIFQEPDFSNMVQASEKLKVSDIYHATEIEVDEKGTKASAITSVQVVPESYIPPPEKPIPFHVNRPFMFNIYHQRKNIVLFSGLVYNPIQN